MLTGRCSSAPPSPARPTNSEKRNSRPAPSYLEIENEHLRQQISLLQFELDKRRRTSRALQESVATLEAMFQNAEERAMSHKLKNRDLLNQLEDVTERFNFLLEKTQNDLAQAELTISQLESQNMWLHEQVKAVQESKSQPAAETTVTHLGTSDGGESLQPSEPSLSFCLEEEQQGSNNNNKGEKPEESSAKSLAAAPAEKEKQPAITEEQAAEVPSSDATAAQDALADENEDPASSISFSQSCSQSEPSLQQAQQHSNDDSSTNGPTSSGASAPAPSTSDHQFTFCAVTMPPPGSRRPRNRLTYGSSPQFQEIRQAYHSVLTSQAAREDDISKWVRNVMSNASPVETDPKKVEPVLDGLRELCEENGLPLPLQRTGPCQYQLGVGVNGKLRVRLINGKLVARSGPAWVDVFGWLEKQPLEVATMSQHQQEENMLPEK